MDSIVGLYTQEIATNGNCVQSIVRLDLSVTFSTHKIIMRTVLTVLVSFKSDRYEYQFWRFLGQSHWGLIWVDLWTETCWHYIGQSISHLGLLLMTGEGLPWMTAGDDTKGQWCHYPTDRCCQMAFYGGSHGACHLDVSQAALQGHLLHDHMEIWHKHKNGFN